MKPALLDYLACPDCRSSLRLSAAACEDAEIIEGQLDCAGCGSQFAIARGVPRFVGELGGGVRATADAFGAQWTTFDDLQPHHEDQLKAWIAPVTPAFVRGRRVLELGCGKGRHTVAVAGWGAGDVVAVDVSAAVDVAFRATRHLSNAHIVQADILRLPLRPVFDYAFSIGVLHHLDDPATGFRRLAAAVHRGGAISAWVYGRENNGWVVNVVGPLRRIVTSRMPSRLLYWASLVPTAILYAALRMMYRPLARGSWSRRLFYGDYLTSIASFPFREIHTIVFDHLTAPTAFYLRRDEVEAWFRDVGARDVVIGWHNRNSWRGFGLVGAPAAQTER